MIEEFNNIIFLSDQGDRDKIVKKYLENLNINDSFVCNRDKEVYTIVYYKKELIVIRFNFMNFNHRNIKIETFNNVELLYNEDMKNGCYENQLEFHVNGRCFKLSTNENDKAIELKKFLIR